MNEKEQKTLTVGDILDQLVKPSVVQGSTPSISQSSKPSTPLAQIPLQPRPGQGDVKLSQAGKRDDQIGSVSLPSISRSAPIEPAASFVKPKLYIRTMADDLAMLKKGLLPTGFETGLEIGKFPERETIVVPPSPPSPLPMPPPSKNIGKIPDLEIPTPQIKREFQVSDKDLLPPFPGAPLPQKAIRPQEDKVEYRSIAKVVSSGMTTGILTTIAVALLIYFVLTAFVFKDEEVVVLTPTPIPMASNNGEQGDELSTIFSAISSINFNLPQNNQEGVVELRKFINNQTIEKKGFKKLNLKLPSSNISEAPIFTEIFDSLAISYPQELKNWLNDDNLVFLYGQDEYFNGSEVVNNNKLVFIVEIKDAGEVVAVMRSWEATMPNDLKGLFDLEPSRQATILFLDNNRQGVQIRYKNFPLPDKSIDYTIITSLTGKRYLILSNSRESMYSPVDKIRGI